ncbi:cytochrome c6 PetJ [Synechococcus elongatus]|uniref:cytochrome c6 PetJ n=1 Tax=Synechococcus elongatus TaxID=32046 RepID=UPI000F7DCBEC|nr:c-type cytochrome [Synechococcus elongatus]
MKRILGTAIAALVVLLAFIAPAQAADLAHGGQVFSANCAACHLGGRNVVNPAKTLQKADLDQYGMASIEAIITQVTNGKGAMPAFGSKLSADDIADVASYVLDQSEKGWQG